MQLAILAPDINSATQVAYATKTGMVGKIGVTASQASQSVISPAAVLKGIHSIAIAHPLALLGFVGGSLALLGLCDMLRQRREALSANAVAGLSPENIW